MTQNHIVIQSYSKFYEVLINFSDQRSFFFGMAKLVHSPKFSPMHGGSKNPLN